MNLHLPSSALAVQRSPVAPRSHIVRFESVSKVYPGRGEKSAVAALSDITLDVAEGAILGVIGRSGAGKSSLIRLINGLERPTSGRVLVDGQDVGKLSPSLLRAARRQIGMIFQHFNLLSSRTVAGNVALPLEVAGWPKAAIHQRIGELLDLVGLADKRDRYPAELSGGQKQRVGIARALATKPKILLSDEATSALDPETTRAILDLLARINLDLRLTIILIIHEMSVIRRLAQDVAVLETGELVEAGSVSEVFGNPQHAVTKSFLLDGTADVLPPSLGARLRPEPWEGARSVIRVDVRGPHADEPILSRLVRALGGEVGILAASVDQLAGRPQGTIILEIEGGRESRDKALRLLAQYEFPSKALGYVS